MSKREMKIIGRLELVCLPELGIKTMQVKVDTGAQTSSLHVHNIVKFIQDGNPWVNFDIHSDIHNVSEIVPCSAPICDIRDIKSSNGTSEQRYVIETEARLGEDSWLIEITLTDRSEMSYLMLFGRQAINKRFLVDSSKVFLQKQHA